MNSQCDEEREVSEVASVEVSLQKLEEAKNIALGWRIVGQTEPQSLQSAKVMLTSSSQYAAQVYELLSALIYQP